MATVHIQNEYFNVMHIGQCIEGTAVLVPLTSPGSNSRIEPNAGRLEICVNNVFGTVQLESPTSFWSLKNALVACRQLGFEGALNTIPPAQYGPYFFD